MNIAMKMDDLEECLTSFLFQKHGNEGGQSCERLLMHKTPFQLSPLIL